MEKNSKAEQVQIRLVSKTSKYELPDTPLVVPTELKRFGLSEIVNHLLSNDPIVPFDFLIEGEFLRTSLYQYLTSKNISTENIITVEFIESLKPPKSLSNYDTDSWISSIQIASPNLIYVGCYDSTIQLWNASNELEASLVGHTGSVKSIISLNNSSESSSGSKANNVELLSAGIDQTTIGWIKSNSSSDSSLEIGYVSYGHKACVNGIAVSPDNSHFITCSTDSTLKLYDTEIPTEDSQREIMENGIEGLPTVSKLLSEKLTKKSKKSKSASSPSNLIKVPKSTFTGHIGSITSVAINSSSKNTFYSGGFDQSLRSWDAVTSDNVSTKVCDQAFLSVDYSALSGLIVSGHTDKFVRIWDPRIDDSSVSSMSLSGHTKYVGAVKWSPNSSYMFASSSYDGTTKVWDVRSTASSMFNIPSKGKSKSKEPGQLVDKLLALDWNHGMLASGGESNELFIHSF
ncbi:Ribosome biogenesis protein ytm1 [Smittium culicis]|uniref:Ribosome biogenesis protein YTM1 n=1 Tax=Smittium culicis TaxID=133412 RepID=A0A1R1X233_9FUNG|nr:Ribosome biogenesis protein ytm1 [Smittium culicis]